MSFPAAYSFTNSAMLFLGRNLCLAAACVLLAAGCGGGGPRLFPVSGQVTYGGEPVEKGEIVFAGATASGAAPIQNGHYQLLAAPGENTVRITATKETGKMIAGGMDEMVPERIDLIPPQFNSASTLVRTVEAHSNTIDFALTP